MRHTVLASAAMSAVLFSACGEARETEAPPAAVAVEPAKTFVHGGEVERAAAHPDTTPVTFARLYANDDAEWIAHGGDVHETRFSTLDAIDTENVGELGLAYAYDLGTDRGVEATPVMVDGVLYVASTWNVISALDAATGELIWRFTPEIDRSQAANVCCGVVNRGVTVHGDHVYSGTIDGRLVALDRETGDIAWEVLTVDQSRPYTVTGAPRVVEADGRALVVIGNGGAELGVRGYVSAYDADTGEMAWRFHTVPGNPEDGFDSDTMATAAETWAGEWWEAGGGGTVWDSMAFDPDLGLLYIGVGNGSPWNHQIRSDGKGDNLFLSSIVALDAATGDYRWHFQTTPGDTWDYTATQHMILADLEMDGDTVPVLMQAPKNGFFYVLDRRDGSFIKGNNFVPVNWASGLTAEGRPIETEGARYEVSPHMQLPGPLGAHNWQPMSFSPLTGLVYIPAQEAGWVYGAQSDYSFSDEEGVWNTGTEFSISALPDDDAIAMAARAGLKGRLLAWDPVANEARWSVEHLGPWNGGTLATAGGLVFQGTADGTFNAYDAATGEVLWSEPVGTGIVAAPSTFEVDGEQHVAIAVGWGGALAYGYGGVFPTGAANNAGRLLVFKAGGEAELDIVEVADLDLPLPTPTGASAETLAHGRRLYSNNCSACHGDGVLSFGGMPNLRHSYAADDAEAWAEIVHGGALAENGMPGFGRTYSEADIEAIRAFVVEAANSGRTTAHFRELMKGLDAPGGAGAGSPD